MMPKNPTLSSAKRALTTSFGPVAFGSLIIAIIRTVRYLLHQAAREGSMAAAIASCLLGCIESLVEYFNSYAYVHVALYGKPFCEAAKDTFRLIKSHGIDAIINDSLVSTVLTMGALVTGVIAGTLTYGFGTLMINATNPAQNSPAWMYLSLVSVLAFLIGFIIMAIVTMVVDSGVQTTFVCLAEDPAALARTKRELYEKFKEVYPQIAWRV